jgi:hypothetical protein
VTTTTVDRLPAFWEEDIIIIWSRDTIDVIRHWFNEWLHKKYRHWGVYLCGDEIHAPIETAHKVRSGLWEKFWEEVVTDEELEERGGRLIDPMAGGEDEDEDQEEDGDQEDMQ